MALGESESQGNGDSSAQLRKEARGRTAKRISRLEHTLGETQAQLERSRSKRDELEHLLQQMVDTESTRQDDLRAREQELERQRVEHQTLRQELEQRVAAAERERAAAQRREQQLREELESAHAELGQRERQARGKLESARSELEQRERQMREELQSVRAELERREAEYRDEQSRRAGELAELRARVAREEELRGELEANLAAARRGSEEAGEQLEVAREERGALEAAYRELHDELERVRAATEEERRRATELEAANQALAAEVEQARADAEDERVWNSELETRLAEMEKQAESVLTGIDEELEISLGRAALERERRVAAEARLADMTESEQVLRAEVARLQREVESAPLQQSAGEPNPALAEAEREIQELRAALEEARSASAAAAFAPDAAATPDADPVAAPDSAPASPQDESLVADLQAEIGRLQAEQEQSRRLIVQLENELVAARNQPVAEPEQPAVPEESLEPGQPLEPEQSTPPLAALAHVEQPPRPDPSTRAPLRDASELASLNDEELAETFSSMRQAARLADDRGDRETAKSHRAIARAAAEEAADRPNFGEEQQGKGVLTRMRGRRRSRVLRELAAARERALDRRGGVPTMVVAGEQEGTPAEDQSAGAGEQGAGVDEPRAD